VRLVVGRVEVYTVPTAREENLSLEAAWAIDLAEAWRRWDWGSIDV